VYQPRKIKEKKEVVKKTELSQYLNSSKLDLLKKIVYFNEYIGSEFKAVGYGKEEGESGR
jgi:hypothetical protein